MPRFEQYEVWAARGEKWELVAAFTDFDVASAVFGNRTYRQRLIHAVYEDGKKTAEDVIAELGSTRTAP